VGVAFLIGGNLASGLCYSSSPPSAHKNKVENQTKTPSAKCAAIKKVVQKKEKKKKEVTKNNQVHALYKDMVYKYRKQSKVAIK